MLAVGYGEGVTVVMGVNEVAYQEGRAPFLDSAGEEFKGNRNVGPVALRGEVNQLAYEVQDMLAALLRRDELLYPVAEEEQPHLVVIFDGGKSQRGGNLGEHVALGADRRAEVEAVGNIHEQHHGQLALLLEHLGIGLVHAGGHVPVYVTRLVAVLVLAHLAECHAASLEGSMVLACKDVA